MRKYPRTGKETFHRGTDISAPNGTPITAPFDGKVDYSGSEKDENGKLKGYGNYVRLKHEDGKFSEYGHLNDLSVFGNVNDKSETKPSAAKGDVIGYVGDTGDSTNPHLHYTRKDKNRKSFPPPQEGLDDLLDSLNGECK